ncbi:kinetochore protein NDC80 homolog [Aristolochia californica]|uniref:kinetochore protein NDC80 homolog n=1 Tax=Aristolochia californica TaxID=171875 RepID=UPI0035D74EE8
MKSRRQGKPPATVERPSIDPRRRDSDASFCSSRPSSVGVGSRPSVAPLNDRSHQSAALKSINAYLHSQSFSTVLRPPLPSAKDITEVLKFLLGRLDLPLGPTEKLEEELPSLLKQLGCPLTLKPSILRTPSTPHAWPTILAVLNWMVQITRYSDHMSANPPQFNDLINYHREAYCYFIRGEDEAVEALDMENSQKFEQQAKSAEETLSLHEKEVVDLEQKLQTLRSTPTARELLEKERSDLVEDTRKFHSVIENFTANMSALENGLADKEKELEVKLRENARICEENEELKKTVDVQKVNVRDAERMKRELAAVEREIAEAEIGRNAWEEKALDLEFTLGQRKKEIEGLITECNQAVKRLKLGNDFQYQLDQKGSTPAEVVGGEYKTKLKPQLAVLEDEFKKNSVVKLEELISLQRQSRETVSKLEAKRKRLEALQSKISEAEARSRSFKKDMEELMARCAAEAERLREDVNRKTEYVEGMEKEASEMLKNYEQTLQNCIKQTDEETYTCVRELLALIDSVSTYKEHMELEISGLGTHLSETAASIAEAYKSSLWDQMSEV